MKSPWEARVGVLIDPRHHTDFVWSYKPYDSALYGGQPRIDWIAIDRVGTSWLIEVKYLPESRKSLNLMSDVTPGQAQALDAAATSMFGIVLLAVGQGIHLYLFDWRDLSCRRVLAPTKTHLVRMEEAFLTYTWAPKTFRTLDIYKPFTAKQMSRMTASTPPPMGALAPSSVPPPLLPLASGPVPGTISGFPAYGTPPTPVLSGPPWLPAPAPPSPSTSKRKVSIHTRRRRLLSGPLLSKPPE